MTTRSARTAQHLRAAAPVLEVFASIQGEGCYVGELQTFLRLRGCPLRCRWCDTPNSWVLGEHDQARIASQKGPRREPAWATPFQAACWIAEVEPGEARTVSVTGGEPLAWPDFLLELRRMLGERRMHLETGGGHPQALARVLDAFQHISLDLKLPQDLDPPVPFVAPALAGEVPAAELPPGNETEWAVARRAELELVASRDACVKVIVAGARTPRTYEPLLLDIARYAPNLSVTIQPVSPLRGIPAPAIEDVVSVAEIARELGLEVRVLPQVHRLLLVP